MEKTTKRIILAFIVGIITLYCSVYGFILYDSHTKGVKGYAYEIKIQNDYLMFLGDMSSSIKLEDITSIQFYENNTPRRNSIKIGTETNIFLVGKTSLEGIGNCTAYLYKDKQYYIQLLTNKTTFIFNLFDKEDTLDLFNELNLLIRQKYHTTNEKSIKE